MIQKEEKNNITESDEINLNLNLFLNFFLRNKFLIGSISLICFAIGCTYSLTLKRIWEGQFQIVLNKKNEESPINFSNFSQNSDLSTEVQKLNSPSVLMPIFEFAISKENKNPSNYNNFSNWKKNFDIKLQKGTSVLNIAYRDTQKSAIIPILEKTSKAYQEYSGRGKRRSTKLIKDYLNQQISFYKEKSSNALRNAQEFAMKEDLIYYDVDKKNSNGTSERSLDKASFSSLDLLLPNVGIENVRVTAANEIRKIEIQLERIKSLEDIEELIYFGSQIPALKAEGLPEELKSQENRLLTINDQLNRIKSIDNDDSDTLQYIGSTIPALTSEGLPQLLKNIEGDLITLRTKYTEEDPQLKKLLSDRIDLTNLLKKRSIKYLKAEKESLLSTRQPSIDLLKQRAVSYLIATKSQAQARMESATRPKGVLMKYKELIREASRNEETLIRLEDNLIAIELEASKKEVPWELITKPTLLKSPVAPSRRVIGLNSLLIGIFIGLAYAIFREKKLDYIYNSEDINKFISTKIISKVKLKESYENDKIFLFLRDYLEKKSTSTISLLVLDGTELKDLESFKKEIKKNKLEIYSNFMEMELNPNKNSKYLILKLGFTKISELTSLKKYIELFNYEFQGIILFEDSNSKSVGNIDDEIKLKSRFIYSYLSNKFADSKSIKSITNKINSKSKSIFSNLSNLLSNLFKK